MAEEKTSYDKAFDDVLHRQFDGVVNEALPESMLRTLSELAQTEAVQDENRRSDLPVEGPLLKAP